MKEQSNPVLVGKNRWTERLGKRWEFGLKEKWSGSHFILGVDNKKII